MCRDRKQRICQSINIETKFFPLHLQRSLPYADLWGVDFAALLVSLCNSNIDIIKARSILSGLQYELWWDWLMKRKWEMMLHII